MTFSVIIPTFNEALFIGDCIRNIHAIAPGVEIIVVDGGSTDTTRNIARSLGATVIQTARGRGYQLNAGAHKACGDIFIFLHVDTRLESNALSTVANTFSDENVQIAVFRLTLDVEHWMLRWYTFCSRLDSVLTRFGDHGLCVRRSFFYRIAGYPNWPLFEEVKFMQKARALTRIHRLNSTATTSARRFVQNGIIRQYFFDAAMMLRYLLGTSPYVLANRYAYYHKPPKSALIIFARYPVLGKVKTRLAKTKGPRYATWFYKRIAEKTFRCVQLLSKKNIIPYIFVANPDEVKKTYQWTKKRFLCLPQEGHTLREKMKNALRTVFKQGTDKALIIGTDIPDLSQDIIQKALALLDSHQVVIGPTHDGGYYLLGMRGLHETLFEGIDWSTQEVFMQTTDRIKSSHLTYKVLPLLRDIDTEEDLIQWNKEKRHAYSGSPQ